jgi:hypothetical protein
LIGEEGDPAGRVQLGLLRLVEMFALDRQGSPLHRALVNDLRFLCLGQGKLTLALFVTLEDG